MRQIVWIGPVSIPYMSPRNESCPAFGRGAVGDFCEEICLLFAAAMGGNIGDVRFQKDCFDPR